MIKKCNNNKDTNKKIYKFRKVKKFNMSPSRV